MEPEPVPLLWILGIGVPLALLLGSATRWVTRGELLVVTRRGVIVRTHGRGPALRLPLLEHTRRLPTGPEELLLAVRVTTRDGGDVRVLLAAEVEVVPPRMGRPFVDPRRAASTALGREVTASAAHLATPDLAEGLTAAVYGVAERATEAARDTGARVRDVVIDEIELLLAPGAETETPARGPR